MIDVTVTYSPFVKQPVLHGLREALPQLLVENLGGLDSTNQTDIPDDVNIEMRACDVNSLNRQKHDLKIRVFITCHMPLASKVALRVAAIAASIDALIPENFSYDFSVPPFANTAFNREAVRGGDVAVRPLGFQPQNMPSGMAA